MGIARAGLCAVAIAFAGQGALADTAGRGEGQTVYEFYCYQCHGYAGDAATLAATYLSPRPRDFAATDPANLKRDTMLDAVTNGRPGTAMVSFRDTITATQIEAVVDYIRAAFMSGSPSNRRYHSAENGWPDHQRYAAAFPFVLGELPLDAPGGSLTSDQRAGLRLYMTSCVSCHDRSQPAAGDPVWTPRAVSYPRGAYSHRRPIVDGFSGATPFAAHDRAPRLVGLSAEQRQGESVFQANCAFCHGADGSGRNWIGSFLEPRPRDFTRPEFPTSRTHDQLREVIRAGLPGTSMPGWGNVLRDTEIDAVIAYLERAFFAAPLRVADEPNARAPADKAATIAPDWRRRE